MQNVTHAGRAKSSVTNCIAGEQKSTRAGERSAECDVLHRDRALAEIAARRRGLVTNEDLAGLVDTTDEWIVERTGIRERRIAGDDEALTDICLPAARRALEMGSTFRPEVIVCDLGLPGMDGYELARVIRRHPEMRDVCLIALSGYAQSTDVERALSAGFDDHVSKPADIHELSRMISRARRV